MSFGQNGPASRGPHTQSIWAVTAYFDAFQSGRRLLNYREFRRRLAVPLVAVELSFDGHFNLEASDADILIRVAAGSDSVMWQKERMLNLGLNALPPHVDAVAWLDSDVVFLREDWPVELCCQLKHFEMVQPFSRLRYLNRDESPETIGSHSEDWFESVAYKQNRGELPESTFRRHGESQRLKYAPGMAWAARRSTLAELGFYDAAILGTGDKLMFAAAQARHHEVASATRMSPPQARHYTQWAEAFWKSIQGRISYVEGDLLHLWHGELINRRYRERIRGLRDFHFDPDADLARTPEGAWRWNSAKPAMHTYVREQIRQTQIDTIEEEVLERR